MRLAELVLLSHVFILVGVTPSLFPFIWRMGRRGLVRVGVSSVLPKKSSTHYVRVERLHIDVSDGAAGKRPHLGFVFESSSDLQREAA